MASEQYNLIFRGEVLEGHEPQVVQQKLAGLLKMEAPQVAKLFGGKPVTLKRMVNRTTAARYQKAFKGVGARLRVTAAQAQAAVENPRAAPTRPQEPSAGDAREKSLAERLAAESSVAPPPQAQRRTAAATGSDWDLAPAGSDLVLPQDRPARVAVAVPDVSHISVFPPNSGSLEEAVITEPPPPAPDVSAMSIARVGADLTDPTEPVPARVPDVSAMTLSEVGVTLVEPKKVVPVEVDVSAISVAEVGSDLADPKDEKPPTAPDTDHIGLDQTT